MNDGGPVFPCPSTAYETSTGYKTVTGGQSGMSLRDKIAIVVMKDCLVDAAFSTMKDPKPRTPEQDAVIAKSSYSLADAMLKERSK